MKTLFAVVYVVLVSITCRSLADEQKPEVKTEEVRDVATLSVAELKAGTKADDLLGKIIKLRFTSIQLPNEKLDWGQTFWARFYETSRKGDQSIALVQFPVEKVAFEWFHQQPHSKLATVVKTVYARVLSRDGDEVRLSVLGRDLHNATTKPEFVW